MSAQDHIDELAHAVAGSAGGLLSMTLTYPLVTLSTNAQVKKTPVITSEELDDVKEEENEEEKSSEDEENKPPQRKFKLTASQVAKKVKAYYSNSDFNAILKNQGIRGFYNGLESALLGIAVTNFIYYYFYELTGSKLSKRANARLGLTASQSIISGAVAGTISRIVTNPIWVANTRMTVLAKQLKQNKDGGYSKTKQLSTLGAIYQIFKNEGAGKLFSGVIPALFLVLNPIIQYTIFEQLKTLLVKSRKRKLTAFDALLLGSLGKLIATIATYPYITLRSRMHLQKLNQSPTSASAPGSPNPSNEEGPNGTLNASIQSLPEETTEDSTELPPLRKPAINNDPNMFRLAYDIIQKEGFLSMYKGLSVKLLQSILSAGFLFYFKEELLVGSDKLIKFIRLFNYYGALLRIRKSSINDAIIHEDEE